MNGRTRASRVATAGSRIVASQADAENLASTTLDFQAKAIARRFGLSDATASVVASLAFQVHDDWRARA